LPTVGRVAVEQERGWNCRENPDAARRFEPFADPFARGLAWDTNGDRDHAIADLTEAVQLRPYSPEMIAALKQLEPEAPDQVVTPGYLKRFLETY
jgi:hypothetical protein